MWRPKVWGKYDPGGFLLTRNPDSVRSPDVAFIQQARLGPRETTFFDGAPDLAVEVVPANDTASELAVRVEDYLSHGCQRVWGVDPPTRTVTAYHPDGSARVHHAGETLSGGEVVPGFDLMLTKYLRERGR